MAGEWHSIGALARETGVKVPTIRFYEQIGLLPPARRTEADWRLYGDDARKRLVFIRHARDLGFPVEDIRALLAITQRPEQPCTAADAIARTQLATVDRKIAQLGHLREELRRMVASCDGGPAAACQVIEALSDATLCEGHEPLAGALRLGSTL